MRQHNRETTDPDPSDDLFFGYPDDDLGDQPSDGPDESRDDSDYGAGHGAGHGAEYRARYVTGDEAGEGRPSTRVESRRQDRRRRRRGLLLVVVAFLVAVVIGAVFLVGVPLYHHFSPSDYSGSGGGRAVVTVRANDGASQIGATLVKDGVVASEAAFTSAASADAKSRSIQPGSYRLRRHMSAASALQLLLNPSARLNSDTVVTEGATIRDVEQRLTAAPCTGSSNTSASDTVCGLGLSKSAVTAALDDVKALGLPTDFTVGRKTPSSAEGFLFPATYPFDDTTTASAALGAMVSKFTDQARATDFTARAKALGITPYQELVVASIAQAEAKFPADMPKVARVILNRLAQHIDLRVDATSAYAAKLAGTDPSKVIYDQVPGPYNTYNHAGLPPTPISNPGAEAMNGAAHPATGNWLFYVNGDAAGHLYFTNSEASFSKAVAKCQANHWGCG